MPEEEISKPEANEEAERLTPPVYTRALRIVSIWFTRLFFFLLMAVFVTALIIPLRPKYSENEKRELTKFPKFTLSALASGDYFDGISEWYADTFPFREKLTDINAFFSALYGKTDIQIQGDVAEGDEIPVSPSDGKDSTDSSDTSSDKSDSAASGENESNESSVPQQSASSTESSTSSEAQSTQSAQTLGALLIYGDTAYEYYNFVRSTADLYVSAINRAAELLDGKTRVYDMIVPTSMGITAPDSILSGVKSSNQRDAIEYMYSGMNGGVKTVSIYDTLKSRKNEYIYFRTDHHWTALGAYYAYADFIKATGGTPAALDSFIPHEFPGYLGSFYTSSKKLPQLAANPDTVYAYEPAATNTAEIHFADGTVKEQPIISDMSASSSKYLTFIKGDRPLTVMRNPSLSDGSVCVVVKESFGNAFVPFLVPSYQTVYVVDYRYFSSIDSRGLVQLCADTGARDLLFINNISATRNKALVEAVNALVR